MRKNDKSQAGKQIDQQDDIRVGVWSWTIFDFFPPVYDFNPQAQSYLL